MEKINRSLVKLTESKPGRTDVGPPRNAKYSSYDDLTELISSCRNMKNIFKSIDT